MDMEPTRKSGTKDACQVWGLMAGQVGCHSLRRDSHWSSICGESGGHSGVDTHTGVVSKRPDVDT